MELGLILAISGGALAVILAGIGSVLGGYGRTSCSGSCSRGSR